MTIKHAIPSYWVDVKLLYNWVHRKFNQFWRRDAVEKASTQQKGPWDPRLSFGDQTSCRQDAVEKASTQQRAGPPGLRLNIPGERERHSDGHKSGEVDMLQFCSVSNSLSYTTLSNKVTGIFFSELYRLSLLCRRYDFVCICIWEDNICKECVIASLLRRKLYNMYNTKL